MGKNNTGAKNNTLNFIVGEHKTIREKLFSVVREHLMSGRFSLGDRVIETRLAQELKISRTPVREALHMLEREGLLESIPRVGYRLKFLTWEEIEDICEIRVVNETLAAKWAIERMKPQDLRALEANLRKTEADARNGNPKAFVDHDAEFHEIIARASGSSRLIELCETLRNHMLLYRLESIFQLETVQGALKGHRRILDCIKRKDVEGVRKAIREHLDYAKSTIRRFALHEEE